MSLPPIDIELLPFRIAADREPRVQREIICRRPYREGGIRLEAEILDGQRVVHCYGHGGSGWTLAPGCGRRILDLILARLETDWADLDRPEITIVGAGVIGLFAAYSLSRYRESHPESLGAISIVGESFEDITSHNAGGLFEPFTVAGREDVDLLVASYDFYHRIARGETDDPDFGDLDIELLSMFSNERDVMPSLVDLGYVPHGLPARMRIGAKVHETYVHQIFFMEVARLMNDLMRTVTASGVRTIRGQRLTSLGEVDSPIVVNCTGMGARDLVGDSSLRPVLGHLLRLQHQPRHLLDVEHNLYVAQRQVGELVAALGPFGRGGLQSSGILESFRRLAGRRSDSLLDRRFPDGWEAPCAELLARWIAQIGELASALPGRPAEADPDLDGSRRVRVFGTQGDRNRFIDGLSLLIRVAELLGDERLREASVRLLAGYLPRVSKRYLFLFERPFVDPANGREYPGLSYFMPILEGPVAPRARGGFRYRSEASAGVELSEVTAGVVGGTTIDRDELTLVEHQREFDRVLERLRQLGFGS